MIHMRSDLSALSSHEGSVSGHQSVTRRRRERFPRTLFFWVLFISSSARRTFSESTANIM